MNKLLTITILLMSTIWSQAQQVNPVPDYVFRNQMSVGRNAVTDTSAYISIGPRYGATKGLMPPVVNDTNAVTGTKRNGLMIFSIQKKNYLFWDSTYGRWSSISGTVDTTVMATRAWRQKGDDSLGRIINQNLVGGGPSVSYYLNHGVVTSVAGYKQMSKVAVINVGADTSKTGNGLVAQFLTDAGDPARLEIPGGAWNFEMWFSISSIGGSVKFYVELLKYNGSTFTSIASSAVVPEEITGGTDPDLYLTSLAVPQTSLLITDRLALRVYIVDNAPGRTVTLHTQNGHLCQIVTTFSAGITALNGLTQSVQNFAVGTTGTDFNISSVTDLHTFNLPTASATNRGALSSANWTTFNNKIDGTGTTNYVSKFTGAGTIGNSQIFDNGTGVAIGTTTINSNTPFHVRQNVNDISKLLLSNPNTGTSAYADIEVSTGSTTSGGMRMMAMGSGYTTVQGFVQNSGILNADVDLTGGLSIMTRANAPMRFYTNGAANERLRIHANGRVGINTGATDYGDFNLQVVGNIYNTGSAILAGTSGNVGIGTVNPTAKLNVVGQSLFNNAGKDAVIVSDSRTQATGVGGSILFRAVYTNGGTPLDFGRIQLMKENSTTADYSFGMGFHTSANGGANPSTNPNLYISGIGNVGIGTASPAEKLDVTSTLSRIVVTSTTNSNNAALYFNAKNSGGTNVQGGVYFIPAATPYLSLSGDNSGTHLNVTSAGNVGIGTASPTDKTHIIGSPTTIDGIFNSILRIQNSSASADGNQAGINLSTNSAGSGNAFIIARQNATAQGTIIFGGYSASNAHGEYMRITPSSELLINTTTDAGDYKLQVAGNIYNTGSAVLAATSGEVLVGTTTLPFSGGKFHVSGNISMTGVTGGTRYLLLGDANASYTGSFALQAGGGSSGFGAGIVMYGHSHATYPGGIWFGRSDASTGPIMFGNSGTGPGAIQMQLNNNAELFINTTSDAGDYKLQVVGNALVSTGKLDITSNTAFGLGLSRSGTSSIAGQVFNSTGVLYYGAESSTGGSIFTGSTLYAGVIGTGANKPLQFATNNIVRMEIDSVGLVGINTTTPTQQLDVNGRARIRTVDSTATAINTLYVDIDGTVKKAQASSQMADDVISPIGSYVAAKDAGSGTVINNVSYVTNGTVKMVTVDAALYITSAGFTESVWNNIGTVPAAYRPKKTVNWNNNYIISGAEYERDDNTDFTGAMDWVITQMRIKDDGSIEINGDINTNSIAVGGTGYVLIPFTISYIVK